MPITNSNEPLASAILKVLSNDGLKQCAVAKKAGFKTQAFNDMLNGRRVIKACDIPKITNALGITPNELYSIGLSETDQPEKLS